MPGCFAVVHRARCRRTPGLAAGRLGRASLTAGGQPIKPDREDFPACRADAPGNCRGHAIRCSKNIMHCGAFNPLTARTEVTAVLPAQEEILAERMAALTAADIPPGDDARWDDGTGRPAELAALDGNGWEELLAAAVPVITGLRAAPSGPADPPDPEWDAFPAGFVRRDRSGGGTGFADGGELDVLAGGLALAGFADDAQAGLPRADDDSLVGVIRAWRRVASWAAARELAAVAELARRRPADRTPPGLAGGFPPVMSEFIPDEVAAALTLTRGAAGAETTLAVDLAGPLAPTAALLAGGRIDLPRARVIADGCATLSPAHAAAVQAAVLPDAPGQHTGQLRRALVRAVREADPDACRKQREEAEKDARVDCWPGPSGTATLAGRNLPPAQAIAADRRLGRIARAWQQQGAAGGISLLRAWAYLALLAGNDTTTPPPGLLPPPAPGARQPGPDTDTGPLPAGHEQQVPAGLRRPGPDADGLPPLAAMINLNIPLTTLMGLTGNLGEAAGYGPIDADTARILACAAAGHRATRWSITVTGPAGHALAHGRAARRAPASSPDGTGWTVAVTAEPIAAGECDHRNAEPGYRPGPALQALIRARSKTCSYHGCSRPAAPCDLDHSIPHDQGGITCECNLAPLCRTHHRMKQAEQWQLEQVSPGVMAWLTPAGRRYITLPSKHPT